MIYLVSNAGRSRLDEGAELDATTLVLEDGTGSKFPSPGSGEGFWVRIGSSSLHDLRVCTARSGDTLTLSQPLAHSWAALTPVINPVNAELIQALVQRVELGTAAFVDVGDLLSGGGGAVGVDSPVASPNALDDEFDGAILDAKWSWRNQESAFIAFGQGWATITSVAGSESKRIIEQTISGSFKVRVKVVGVFGGQYNDASLTLFNNGSGRGLVYRRPGHVRLVSQNILVTR
ncbi:MAG: hypothetical protein WCP34_09130 [Pseudomonadota bacterium]